MNKFQKTLLINNLKECLSYLLSDNHETADDLSKRDVAKLLTSVINDINLAKDLLNKTTKQRWRREYDTILQLIDKKSHGGVPYAKNSFSYLFEYKFGLKGCHSIRKHINTLAAAGYIKFYEKEIPESKRRIKVMKVVANLKTANPYQQNS
ncbi:MULTISPECIES: hypothetical protein [Wolbachia]|uniref:hypothetical protein n=1 Tax=Wolbachia TaxID=953 RepID=UPI00222F74E9|nr:MULTISPECIES: hypothetical protein [unclassified Wolbachia]MDV6249371.1 hypothetical protein [Wolbachia endosymbiont of Zaprionus taronus]